MKIDKHIEIVCSDTLGLSSMSKPSRNAILAVLGKHYARVGITVLNDLSDLEELVASGPDLVFLGMKFLPVNPELGQHDSEKIWISEYLDAHDIAYTGSNQLAHELELDKSLAKQRILDAGLSTSHFYVHKQNQRPSRASMSLEFPLFIKPTNRGGGMGIDSFSVAHNFEQLDAKVESLASELQSDSLVEQYLSGREFSVAILKDEYTDSFSVMPLELIAPADKNGVRLLSAKVKSADSERFIEVTDVAIRDEITDLAIDAFHALGARDYGRIDIRLDESGTPHFLEANLIPSLIRGYGNFPKACVLNMGLAYKPMLLQIVALGLARAVDADEETYETDINLPIASPA